MSKTSYILTYMGKPAAVINAESQANLKEKTILAVKEHLSVEPDTQFSLLIRKLGDWGEDTQVIVQYVDDGNLITDGEFTLTKTVSY